MPPRIHAKKIKQTFDQKSDTDFHFQQKKLRYFHTWEQRQFKTFAGRSAVWDLSSKECPCIEYQNIEAGTGNLKKDFSSNNAIKLGQKFSKGDIVFGKLRPYLKNWFYAEFSGVAVGDFWIFSPKEVDSYFLYALIQGKDFLLATNQSVGSKMPRADWKLIASRPFRLPTNRAQQRRIGSLFIQLEHLITLHQRKLTKLQNVKKALLEKMFV